MDGNTESTIRPHFDEEEDDSDYDDEE